MIMHTRTYAQTHARTHTHTHSHTHTALEQISGVVAHSSKLVVDC